MTREFSFKLATIGIVLMTLIGVSLSIWMSIFSGNAWNLLLVLASISLWTFTMKVGLKRELRIIGFIREAIAYSPGLALAERFYFYSYSLFLLFAIGGMVIFAPIFIDIPVSYGLSRLGFHEMAERVHSLDYAWDGINQYPFAVMAKGFPTNFHKFDLWKLEDAVLKVHGEKSVQYAYWLMNIGNDEKIKDLSIRKNALKRAIKISDSIGKVQSSILAKSILAEMEAESKNFSVAQNLASEISSTIDAPNSKYREERILSNLASTYHFLGFNVKAKALDFEVGKLSAKRERGYLLNLGYLPLLERTATLVVLVASFVAMFFCLIYAVTYEFLFWKNEKIARTSRNCQELVAALNLLIPLSLAKRKQKLADEYSQRLVELVQREA